MMSAKANPVYWPKSDSGANIKKVIRHTPNQQHILINQKSDTAVRRSQSTWVYWQVHQGQ